MDSCIEQSQQWDELYRTLADLSMDAVSLICDGRIVFVNDMAVHLSGAADRESLVGQSIFEFIPPEKHESARQILAFLRTQTGGSYRMEQQVTRKDGTIITVDVVSGVLTYQGKTLIQSIIRDITPQKRLEQELDRSRELYGKLVEVSPDAVVVLGLDNKLISINEQAARMFGFDSVEQAIAETTDNRDFFSPQDRPRVEENIARTLQEGAVRNVEYTFVRRDGSSFFGEISAAVLRDDDGQPKAFIGIVRDTTGRKEAEQRIQASLREKELHLYEIHHRVKNNLQIVCSLINLQALQIGDEKASRAFTATQNRVRSIALLHEFLYRGENQQCVPLSPYMATIASNLFRSHGTPEDAIDFAVSGDELCLDQSTALSLGLIVNELVANCLKHAFPTKPVDSSPAIPKQQIRVVFTAVGGDSFKLVVADNGCGLTPGNDPFTTESFGLQLVSGLVDQLEGTVTVDSSPHRGTSFSIVFPGNPGRPGGSDTATMVGDGI